MGQISDSTIRDIVRAEVSSMAGDIKREIGKLDNRIQTLHALQSDIQRTIHDIEQVMGQTKNIASLSSLISQMQISIDEIRVRAKHSEESSRYTAGYVAMRLKERYDQQY